jgi:hypothetical protein
MANKRIPDLDAAALPATGDDWLAVDDGVTTRKRRARDLDLYDTSVTRDADGLVDTITKQGRVWTVSRTDGLITSMTDGTNTITINRDAQGNFLSKVVS